MIEDIYNSVQSLLTSVLVLYVMIVIAMIVVILTKPGIELTTIAASVIVTASIVTNSAKEDIRKIRETLTQDEDEKNKINIYFVKSP